MLTNARTLTLISNSIYSSSPHVDLSHHLAAPFTSLEAKLAISQMNQNSAQTYSGFYAAAWETVAPKILEFVHGFANGQVDHDSINKIYIGLLPKKQTWSYHARRLPSDLLKDGDGRPEGE